ncbi:uncharacterized protein [Medicago truncatula]|uniref:uncharacterized protein n=1 Tax=Medicago truncatula TaxID=3880 RepID=UPI000D2F3BAA|nr:uncharacterized protein LOC112419410 [Medicago truncatula]
MLNGDEAALFCCILWSIWKQRNNKVWNGVIEAQVVVLERAKVLLQDWRAAKSYQQHSSRIQNTADSSKWKKPTVGQYKCNIDASFSKHLNKVGIGICIRDDTEWVHELNLGLMDFEMDAKKVADNFLSTNHDATEFENIIQNCQSLFRNYYENSKVEFVRRQANEAAHALVKAATLSASFQLLYVIPDCIEHILINEML